MKILIGNMPARCLACRTDDWRSNETAPNALSLFSEVICEKCGYRARYADLVLQSPLEPGQSASLIWTDQWDEEWLSAFK